MKNNIVFCGFKGCGKSRAAATLKEHGYTTVKLATPLKNIICRALELDDLEHLKDAQFCATVNEKYKCPKTGEDRVYTSFQVMFRGQHMGAASDDVVLRLAHATLMELGMSKHAANTRIMEDSMRKNPICGFNGLTTENICDDIWELIMGYERSGEQVTFRQLLQHLGTDIMRNKWGADFHIKLFKNLVADVKQPVVVDDARFPNELAFCRKELDATIVMLHRPNLKPEDFHESEVSVGESDCDIVIRSNEGEQLDETIKFYAEHEAFPQEDVIRIN